MTDAPGAGRLLAIAAVLLCVCLAMGAGLMRADRMGGAETAAEETEKEGEMMDGWTPEHLTRREWETNLIDSLAEYARYHYDNRDEAEILMMDSLDDWLADALDEAFGEGEG